MIIPALDLINGHIVRLYQGCYHKQHSYCNDPSVYLQNYFNQGAEIIHLVDLDGAKNPINRQKNLIYKLLNINPRKKIQVGGGIRHTKDIEELLKKGANRVVFSSQAVNNPRIIKTWFEYFEKDTLVLALDVRINTKGIYEIAINGWQKNTHITLQDMIEEYYNLGIIHILCTDISKDGTLTGANIKLYETICKKWPNISFQSSGGIKELKEIHKLRHAGIENIIIGRAFLEERFTVAEAISCWQNE